MNDDLGVKALEPTRRSSESSGRGIVLMIGFSQICCVIHDKTRNLFVEVPWIDCVEALCSRNQRRRHVAVAPHLRNSTLRDEG